jgi:hypothetical protein
MLEDNLLELCELLQLLQVLMIYDKVEADIG